jgi:hypothetical protein
MPSPAPFRFNLADGTPVDFGRELIDGQPIVSVRFNHAGKPVKMLASPAYAVGKMADIVCQGGADDLADAFRRAARQAMQLRAPRQRRPGHAARTVRSAGQRHAAEQARKLAAAAAKGPAAVADLLGCPRDADAIYLAAFHAAVNRIHDLLALVEQLALVGDGLKEWSNAYELCTWLGVPKNTLNWWNTTGQGPRRYRMGKGNRYRRADVEKWLDTRSVPDGRPDLRS